ncbi:MAG: hypothetical protein ACD_87C00273G0005 [uncultured bacterium]|nr:MAG: hypothetical protein ACD_87C00273G0005 [uncultured bacterium]
MMHFIQRLEVQILRLILFYQTQIVVSEGGAAQKRAQDIRVILGKGESRIAA